MVRAGTRPVPAPDRSTWLDRYWVSIVGLSVGMIVSIWKFGVPQFPRHERPAVFTAAEFHWHGTVASGHQVAVKGMSGAIHAVASDNDEVTVTAVKRSRGGNPAEVPIAVVQQGGDVTVCIAASAGASQCAEGDEGLRGGVNVDYTVSVPQGVNFEGNSVNGGITIEGLAGDVNVETVNGGIQLATTGTARAETVNGSIRASVGSTARDLSFETINGSITVALPENAAVDVNAQTMSGNIHTDFGLAVEKAKPGQPRKASGKIGAGGSALRLETVNGSIDIQKAGSEGAGKTVPPRPTRGPRGKGVG